MCVRECRYPGTVHAHTRLPVLCVGEVAGALVDLQGALTRAFAFILLHPAKQEVPRRGVPDYCACMR